MKGLLRRLRRQKRDERVVPGTIERELMHSLGVEIPGRSSDDDEPEPRPEIVAATLDEANVVTSVVKDKPFGGFSPRHAPVLDLDVPVTLVPSTTPGHSHLYIDVPMSWHKYQRLMKALADAGVIEEGYYEASKRRGYSAVRLPWVRKPEVTA